MENRLLTDLQGISVFPGIELALPTMGNFYYPEDEIFAEGFDPGKVKVNALGIASELSVKDPLMVLSRQSTPMLVQSVCPMVKRPEMLSEIDIVAIILAGRIASYGPKYRVEHVCQNPASSTVKGKGKDELTCKNARESKASVIEVDLYEHILRYAPYTDWDQFSVDLPEVGQRVVVRPSSYQSFLHRLKVDLEQNKIMNQYRDTDVSEFLTDDVMVDAYKGVLKNSTQMGIDQIVDSIFFVESIKGNYKEGDRTLITQWIKALPVPIVERVIKQVNKIREDIIEKSLIDYRCEECGHVNKVMIELDAERLFSSGSQGTPEPLTIKMESPVEIPVETSEPSPPPPTTEPSGRSSRRTRRTETPNSRIFSR